MTALHEFKYDPGTILILPAELGGEQVKVREFFYNVRAEPIYRLSRGDGSKFIAPAATVEKLYTPEQTRYNVGKLG